MCGLNKQNLSVDDILVGNFPEEKVIPSIWLLTSRTRTRERVFAFCFGKIKCNANLPKQN
jgi:hypothetical protein